ncbi:unnamed protein product [Rotaria sordida]|uniref:Uncharacterized protein n=1 Tax=Rotaria sordida TaxID=392033 RepID=A0A814ZE36_9BILA|nr:unnamed protein product [Rotaria sordida]
MTSLSISLKAPCIACGNKSAGIFRCEGCLQVFCRKHLNEHRDFLSHQLDEIAQEHDILQQIILHVIVIDKSSDAITHLYSRTSDTIGLADHLY